jgi:hypothetical protein
MIQILLIALGISLCLNAHLINREFKRFKLLRYIINNQDTVLKRNNDVADFRRKVLYELGSEIYESMVSQEDMIMSDVDLTLDNYIPDKYLEEAKSKWS